MTVALILIAAFGFALILVLILYANDLHHRLTRLEQNDSDDVAILNASLDRLDRRLRALENRTSSTEAWINDHATSKQENTT
jgi:hypothetical protein